MNSDSVWNFHVWNDVWMTRPDLPQGFGGWQAIDATPQELSDGVYCCGPASLTALKKGEVNMLYDAKFVFAEVNADQIDWVKEKDGSYTKIWVEKRSVGEKVCTYKPLCKRNVDDEDTVEDITNEYKFREGSAAERFSVIRANLTGSTSDRNVFEIGDKDVEFEFVPMERVRYGKDFIVTLKATNNSSDDRTLGGSLLADTIYYTGVAFKHVKTDHFREITVSPGESKEIKMEVKVHEYLEKLTDHCNFNLSCLCRVEETNQVFPKQAFMSLVKPDLMFQTPKEIKIGEKLKIEVSFTNPLPEKLTKCEIRLEGSGIQKPRIIPQRNVNPNAVFKTVIEVVPRKKGEKEIFMCFNSTQIENVTGSLSVMVKET